MEKLRTWVLAIQIKKFLLLTFFLISAMGFGQYDSELTRVYPKAQKEVKNLIDQIESNIRNNQVEELIALHAYGPKFTEFDLGGKRQGPEENEQFERNVLGKITDVEKWEWNDLQINVYGGDVANVTFHANFKFKIGKDAFHYKMQGSLLFIKLEEGWRITHEHHAPLTLE